MKKSFITSGPDSVVEGVVGWCNGAGQTSSAGASCLFG